MRAFLGRSVFICLMSMLVITASLVSGCAVSTTSIASGCTGGTEWMEKGYGPSKAEATFNAKWSCITQALKEVIGAQSQTQWVIDIIKEKFSEDESRYLRAVEVIYVKRKDERYVAKVIGCVDMSAIDVDANEIIRIPGGNRKLPSIAIRSGSDTVAGYLAKKFKDYGYTFVDYKTRLEKYKIEINQIINEIPSESIMVLFRDAGVDYLVDIMADYKNEGENKVTGGNRGTLSLEVRIISTEKDAEVLSAVADNFSYSSLSRTEEKACKVAVENNFSTINAQIINDWEKRKNQFTANFQNIDDDSYYNIILMLAEFTGDQNPREATDDISRNVYFKLEKEKTLAEKIELRGKIKEEDGVEKVNFENNVIKVIGN